MELSTRTITYNDSGRSKTVAELSDYQKEELVNIEPTENMNAELSRKISSILHLDLASKQQLRYISDAVAEYMLAAAHLLYDMSLDEEGDAMKQRLAMFLACIELKEMKMN